MNESGFLKIKLLIIPKSIKNLQILRKSSNTYKHQKLLQKLLQETSSG